MPLGAAPGNENSASGTEDGHPLNLKAVRRDDADLWGYFKGDLDVSNQD